VLAEWLASYRVTRVGMESTECYWKPASLLRDDTSVRLAETYRLIRCA
jgi:hypothetical protein